MGETMPTKQSAAEMAAEVLALRARVSDLEDATRYGEKVCAELVAERDAARKALEAIKGNAESQLVGMNAMGTPDKAPERIAAIWYYAESCAALKGDSHD